VDEERVRLWQQWRNIDENRDGYAARRPGETAVVIFEPAPSVEASRLAGGSEMCQ
jgi:hypothetical protein